MQRHHREPGPENLVVAARAVGVTDLRVLTAIWRSPGRRSCRSATPPGPMMTRPSPISRHQVSIRPSPSAAIIAALGLTGTEEVFGPGSGRGYQVALLAARVASTGIWPDLAGQDHDVAAHGIGNVVVLAGDGTGEPRNSPIGRDRSLRPPT